MHYSRVRLSMTSLLPQTAGWTSMKVPNPNMTLILLSLNMKDSAAISKNTEPRKYQVTLTGTPMRDVDPPIINNADMNTSTTNLLTPFR